MKFLYLILLATATFCYDSELLNYPEVFKAKYSLFDEIKKLAYSNPMPDNYKDYLDKIQFSGNFLFDIIPIDNWKQEAKKILSIADSQKEKDWLSNIVDFSEFSDSGGSKDSSDCNPNQFNCIYNAFNYYSNLVTTSKGKFVMYYYAKGVTFGVLKNKSGKVKVCKKTNVVFKICSEYELTDAALTTVKAYTYSKIKEKINNYM